MNKPLYIVPYPQIFLNGRFYLSFYCAVVYLRVGLDHVPLVRGSTGSSQVFRRGCEIQRGFREGEVLTVELDSACKSNLAQV